MTVPASQKAAPTDPATFFRELERRGHEIPLRKVSGRVRFDVVEAERTDSWLVTVDNGALVVTHGKGAADCSIQGRHAVFDELVTGRMNALAAVLRGALTCRGDLELLFAIQRIFPDPPRGWDPTAGARSG